jgi:protein TonB
MSTTTINSFPPLHTFDSPRAWFMAIIVLLHVGFVWAVNNGLSITKLILPPPKTDVVFVDEFKPIPPEPVIDVEPTTIDLYVPTPVAPTVDYAQDEMPPLTGSTTPNRELPPISREQTPSQPTIVEPMVPARGLSDPLYPPSAIRAGHTGTVVLSLEILENGRVGQIQLLQSSGYEALDESAMREARKWRFVPGTRDGVPVVRWKQIPITFALENRK